MKNVKTYESVAVELNLMIGSPTPETDITVYGLHDTQLVSYLL